MATENFLDLAARAKEGIFIHPVMWLLVGWGGRLESTAPWMYFGIAGVFAMIAIVRRRFELTLARVAATGRSARVMFTALLLSNPGVWSFATVLAILQPELADARTGLMYSVVALAAAAGMGLVIEPVVRRSYAPLALMPGGCALLLTGHRTDQLLGAMALLMMLYVLRASNVVHADYWNAVDARADLEQRARHLELLSITDALTQLRNRPYFDRQLAAEWARARRSNTALALLIIDIDHFKKINDGHGHAVGDACLQAMAAALREALYRPDDLVARYGGEEFVVMLPAISAEGAVTVAERIRQGVAAIDYRHDGVPIRLSCSIGLHRVTDFVQGSIAQALAGADRAMYEAKGQGRNRVVATWPAADEGTAQAAEMSPLGAAP